MKLHIAKHLVLPVRAVTEKIGILGTTGAGKTTTASVIVEEMLKLHLPVDIVDLTDAWWGLRSSKDGKEEGYPVTVLGGDHGDVPLEETAGAVVADLIAESAPPLVISLALFTKGGVRRFMADFLEELYRKNRRALHLVLDETDEYAPQDPRKMKGGERLFGAVDTIVRRGRLRGLGVTMISQRSAEISKSIVSQCSVLFAHRASHPTDVDPILHWMKYHAKNRIEAVSATIAELADGEAWVMSPHLLKVFDRYQIRDRETFDSSKTPEPGERQIVPKRLAKPDLALLQEKMKDTIERAKANDPATLRRRIAELEREVAKKPAAAPPAPAKVETKRVEVPVLKDGQVKRLETAIERAGKVSEGLEYAAQKVREAALAVDVDLHNVVKALAAPRPAAPSAVPRRPTPAPQPLPRRASPAPATVRAGANGATGAEAPAGDWSPESPMSNPERGVLVAAAQHHPRGVTRVQLSVLLGHKRSYRDLLIQKLARRGLIEARGDRIVATEAGIAALGSDFVPLPTGPDLLAWWRQRLPAGELAVLDVAVAAYPEPVDRDAISEVTNQKRSYRDLNVQRLSRRELLEEAGRGQVRASDTLFS